MNIIELTKKAVELASKDEKIKERTKHTVTSIVMILKNEEEHSFTLAVNKGKLEFLEEGIANPDFQFEMSEKDYSGLMTGKAYGMVLMATGKMKMTKGSWAQIGKIATPLGMIPKAGKEIAAKEKSKAATPLAADKEKLNALTKVRRRSKQRMKGRSAKLETVNIYSESVLESIPDGVIVTDLEGNIIAVNKAILRKNKRTKEEVIGKFAPEVFIKPQDIEKFMKYFSETLEKGYVSPFEGTGIAKDGTEIPTIISVSLLKDAEGNPYGFFCVVRDITELKRAEEKRVAAVRERVAVVDAIPDPLIVLDLNGAILSVNPAYTRMFGWKPEERIRKSFGEMRETLKAEDIERFMELLGQLVETGHVEPVETVIHAKDGREIPDGYVHLVKGGKQIVYYTMSEKLALGIKMLLLQFEIQTTIRKRNDGTFGVTINDYNSIQKFKEKIGFNNEFRRKRLYENIEVNYHKPVLDRIPVTSFVRKIAINNGIGIRELLRNGINVKVDSLIEEQIKRFLELIKEKGGEGQDIINLQKLVDTDILWSKVKEIKESEAHVYDFTVSNEHNFIANGFIVHNSEARLRSVFEDAQRNAPAILFIDEIDAIAPKREEMGGEKQVERRVVAQLLALMDGLESRGQIIVIAATNIPNVIDPALRRPGRFDREIEIDIPDKNGRLEILQIHTRGMPLAEDVDLERLSQITHGFVGADLEALCREAAMTALRGIFPSIDFELEEIPYETLLKLEVTMDDFMEALKEVEPSAIREVFTEIPDVRWDDVGGLENIKGVLRETIEWPLKYSKLFDHAKTKPPKGILLYGAPGTGKTLLAKAVASESEVNFISVKGPELMSKFVGESERGVREVFKKAKQASPCIVFFDELDSLAPARGAGFDSHVTDRTISQFLTEMDGIEDLKGVVVLAATNRLDIVDPALLRAGRFDFLLELPVPDESARLKIFKVHAKGKPLASDVDLKLLAQNAEGLVGADIESICRKASMLAIREFLDSQKDKNDEDYTKFKIAAKHFNQAIKRVKGDKNSE